MDAIYNFKTVVINRDGTKKESDWIFEDTAKKVAVDMFGYESVKSVVAVTRAGEAIFYANKEKPFSVWIV